MQKDKIILNVIPVLKSGNVLIKAGQVCTAKTASLSFYSVLSCNGAYYTNIEGEEPLTEADIIDSGRTTALTGYGAGITSFDIRSGNIRWKPEKILKLIDMVKLSKKPEIGAEIMPVLMRPSNSGDLLYNVDTGEELPYTEINGTELLANLADTCNWAGISHSKHILKIKNALENCVIGWPSLYSDAVITTVDDIKAGELSLFKFYKDSCDLVNILNTRIVNLLSC